MIDVCELKENWLYVGLGRNFKLAVWHAGKFYGMRVKYGQTYVDRESHVDDDNGTFTPVREVCCLTGRLTPACFDPHEWRTRDALPDMLFAAGAVLGRELEALDGHPEE